MAFCGWVRNIFKIFFAQALQFDRDGETPLQFGDEVFHLGNVKGARRDKENKIRLNGAVFRHDRAALHDGKDISLHALARHVRAALVGFARDLVDLVDEDDALFLGAGKRLGVEAVLIDEFFAFLRDDLIHGGFDAHLAFFLLLGKDIPEYTA